MKKIIFALLILTSTTAMAEWTTVGVDSVTGAPKVAIDYSKTFTSNGLVYTWYKDFTFGNLESVDYPGYHPISVTRIIINCNNRTASRDYLDSYITRSFNSTDIIKTKSPTKFRNVPFSPEEPGTAGDFVVNTICRK
jgi:hypothetical protein